jgi:hypothetical protein
MANPRTALACVVIVASVLACGGDDKSPTDNDTVIGSTQGFLNGAVVTLEYTRDFFCQEPPPSGATSNCVLGAPPQTRPSGATATSPIVYVLTPLFSPLPAASTLHCPNSGSCVGHPTTVDVSVALGPAATNFPLPPHSLLIETTAQTGTAYEARVVGVYDLTTWNTVVAGRSLTTVRAQQAADPAHAKITIDTPTNLFLFFRTR